MDAGRSRLEAWVEQAFGHTPVDPALFERAVTHASHGTADYERLEFLGDRVLGLAIAQWLVEIYSQETEGKLSHRFNALVSGEVCADIGRSLGVPAHLRLGKQAQDDGVFESDNVIGDAVEALIGAIFLEAGLDGAARSIRRIWGDRVDLFAEPPKHPKAVLQEWTGANGRRPPAYRVVGSSGPDHAPRFTVEVSINGMGEATGEGNSKQEAEKAAAVAMIERLQ
jgi:ribonuclease-3